MTKRILSLLTLLLLLASTTDSVARRKTRIKLKGTSRKGSTVAVTINATKPFIVGSNIYVLYIGDKHFDQSKEDISNPKKHRMSFFIPSVAYNSLQNGERMYVTYGYLDADLKGQDMKALCKEQHIRCWSLGRFHKRKKLTTVKV